MSQSDQEKREHKQAMKKLRAAREQTIKAAVGRMKEQKKAVKAIKQQLEDKAGTVPEIATATDLELSEVMWFIATLKKYGEIIEGEKDGSYFRYCLAVSSPGEKSA